MSPNVLMSLVLACLVKDAVYTDAAPTIALDELTASDAVQKDDRALHVNDNENETDDTADETAFENFIQGLHNIDTAMEAMIDNYTDGVEHLGEENGLQENESSETGRTPPERDAAAQLAKGPLSGMVPGGGGGGGESTTATGVPAGAAVPFGIPGGALAGDDKGGASPTLVFGGFSMMLVPVRGTSMANMASMLSAGQQLGQMVPKPGGGS